MILSLNWLRDYLQKPDLKIDPKKLADQLTMRGIHVASIKHKKDPLEHVVVGRIEKIEKHPNADRLQVTQVVIQNTPDAPKIQIVCGAKNIAEGDIVPVALPGSILPGNLEIKASAIRGVESKGMLCSGKELGVAEDSEGILSLPKHAVIGEPLSRLLGKRLDDDVLLEFELTPNRSDCMSVIGLAREIAPLLDTKLRDPKPNRFKTTEHRTSSIVKIEIEDMAICPRYVARVIDGLKIQDSPDWIKEKLEAVGIRPVNNVVDITNLVMLEYGQPLHAFDLRRISSGIIRVATCKMPSDFTLLSGETVCLEPGDILIQDGDHPIGLAGIMGGANSQVTADTTSILLESAAFPAKQIRKTAKHLGIQSEAAKRFEKGTDLAAVLAASDRAASLLRDSFNANVYHPPIDTNENGVREHSVAVDLRDVRRITGLKGMTAENASELLESIEIPAQKKSVNILSVKLPSHRHDIKASVDLIEEIARLAGYENIPLTFPHSVATFDKLDESAFDFEYRARQTMVNLGFRETIHYSFVSENLLKEYHLDHDQMVHLKNPISDEMRTLRTSLLGSLLTTYIYNRNRNVENIRIFEVARTYRWDSAEETKVKETPFLSGLISGKLMPVSWKANTENVDFYFLKGIVEAIIKPLTNVVPTYLPISEHKLFHPTKSASIVMGHRDIGHFGEIHPAVIKHQLETTEPVLAFELDLDALVRYEKLVPAYKTPTKFPSVDIDIALLVNKSVTCQSLVDQIKASGGELLKDVVVFDHYEGERIPADKKSLAFHMVFLSADRTLQDQEVMQLRDKVTAHLKDKFAAELRT